MAKRKKASKPVIDQKLAAKNERSKSTMKAKKADSLAISKDKRNWAKRTYVSTKSKEVVKIDVERIAEGAYKWIIKAGKRTFERFNNSLPPTAAPWDSWRLE